MYVQNCSQDGDEFDGDNTDVGKNNEMLLVSAIPLHLRQSALGTQVPTSLKGEERVVYNAKDVPFNDFLGLFQRTCEYIDTPLVNRFRN